jgi:osmotically-inducible protein OsmY
MYKKTRVLKVMILLTVAACSSAAASDADLTRDIQRQLSNLDYGSRRPVVTVADSVVTVSGTVASLWLKEETISRALKAKGIASLVSEITIAKAESDEKLAADVSDRIQKYSLLSVFDDIQGNVHNGSVRLAGAVTEDKKLSDIVERVAKIRGVQAIENKVVVLPVNQQDDQIRVRIATAIYRDDAFLNYSMANPPVHIVVANGRVILTGIVRSDIERIKAHEAAVSAYGVLSVDDRVRLAKDVK